MRERPEDEVMQKNFLDFLLNPLKDQLYVALAYMTGILPIKKYEEHSAIYVFDEYSMVDAKSLGEYFGFTTEEVRERCQQYGVDSEQGDVSGVVECGRRYGLERIDRRTYLCN